MFNSQLVLLLSFIRSHSNKTFSFPMKMASPEDEDPNTKAIQAEVEQLIKSKAWKENAAKNDVFGDVSEPSKATSKHKQVPAAAPIEKKFTTLQIGKRQRIN